jgi:hypothetical protein
VLASPFGVATTRPAGSVSVKPTPVSAVPAFGLVSVNDCVVVPFTTMLAAPNAVAIVGGATTVRLAEAVPAGPVSADVTAPVVLFFVPALVPVTCTTTAQEPLAGSVAPVRLTLDEPATAVTAPPHVLLSPSGLATTRPAGNESLNPTAVSAPLFEFVSVTVSAVVSLSGRLATPNALPIVGGATTANDSVLDNPLS